MQSFNKIIDHFVRKLILFDVFPVNALTTKSYILQNICILAVKPVVALGTDQGLRKDNKFTILVIFIRFSLN